MSDSYIFKIICISVSYHVSIYVTICIFCLLNATLNELLGVIKLQFLLSHSVFCYADMGTSALELYHKIRGLYLMWSWLMLIANFQLFRSKSPFALSLIVCLGEC